MNGVLTAGEQERLRLGLAALPDTMPPRAVWRRIEEQARAQGLLSKPAAGKRMKWLLGAGIAAAVALGVLRMPGMFDPVPRQVEIGNNGLRATPDYARLSNTADAETLGLLMVQSRQLEMSLRAIPYQPRVMRASTAATISSLEDRIAAIDFQINQPAIRMNPAEEQLFWRERVRLMDSLVKLRYAQAQRVSF